MNRAPDRLLAAAVVALLLLSLLRTRGADREPPRRDDAVPSATAPPAAAPGPAGALLRLEIQAEVPFGSSGPPLELRVRARESASRPFDVTAREERTRQQLAVAVPLPVKEPELPLRVALQGDDWCLPPGRVEFDVPRLDPPWKVVLMRARTCLALVASEGSGAPLPQVELVHESGVVLATTALDGRAMLVRPRSPESLGSSRHGDLVIARAAGFLPAALDESANAPLVLRESARGGRLEGRVLDVDGAPVADALVQPRCVPANPAGGEPQEPAARALHRLLAASAERDLPALAQRTGADGRFAFPVAWPGAVTLTASHRALGRASATARGEGLSDAGRVTTLDLRFPATFELRVSATSGGKPLAGGSIELITQAEGRTTTLAATLSDAQGRATLRAPAIAPLWLLVRSDRLAPADRRELEVDVTLESGRAVTLTVTGAERLPPGQRVLFGRDAASGQWLGEQPLDASGAVRLDHLPVGRRIELLLTLPGGGAAPGEPLRELELPPASDDAAPADVDLGAIPLPGG